VRVQLFGVGGELQWQQQEQKEEDNPHGEPRNEHVASEFSVLPAWEQRKRGMDEPRKRRLLLNMCPCLG
jgi:hypothetical protein